MKSRGIYIAMLVVVIFGCCAFIITIGTISYSVYIDNFKCSEHETKYYRYSGNFLLRVAVETTEEKADISKQKCVKHLRDK